MKRTEGQVKYFLATIAAVLSLATATAFSPQLKADETTAGAATYTTTTHTYKTVDGHDLKADVYQLPGEQLKPSVLYIHGGALVLGSRDMVAKVQFEPYLRAGYNIVSIDYRLAPETKLPGIIEDVQDAYTWMRTEGPVSFGVDPARIAVAGHSAGGYLTLMAGFRFHPLPRALVSFFGYGDITSPWYSQPDPFYNTKSKISKEQAFGAIGKKAISSLGPNSPLWEGRISLALYLRQQGVWPKVISGHDPVTDKSWFSDYEPRHNVTVKYPPTLLLHGEKDTDVPVEQSLWMAEELRRYGVTHELITDPDWGHGFDSRAFGGVGMDDLGVREAYNRVLKFLNTHIGTDSHSDKMAN